MNTSTMTKPTARIERDRLEVPDLETRHPPLAEARAELAEITRKHNQLVAQKAAHIAAREEAKYRDADGNDVAAMADKRNAARTARLALEAIASELPELRRRHVEAQARVEAAHNEARRLARADVQQTYVELLRASFLEALKPFAPAIIAHEKLERLATNLAASGAGYGSAELPPRVHLKYVPSEALKRDATQLIQSGVITVADLPAGLAAVWGVA